MSQQETRTFTPEQSQAMYEFIQDIASRENTLKYDEAYYIGRWDAINSVKQAAQRTLQALATPQPATEPAYKQARGITGWQEGDERAEDAIRRMRDGEPAREPATGRTVYKIERYDNSYLVSKYVDGKHDGYLVERHPTSSLWTYDKSWATIYTKHEAEQAAAAALNADSTGQGG